MTSTRRRQTPVINATTSFQNLSRQFNYKSSNSDSANKNDVRTEQNKTARRISNQKIRDKRKTKGSKPERVPIVITSEDEGNSSTSTVDLHHGETNCLRELNRNKIVTRKETNYSPKNLAQVTPSKPIRRQKLSVPEESPKTGTSPSLVETLTRRGITLIPRPTPVSRKLTSQVTITPTLGAIKRKNVTSKQHELEKILKIDLTNNSPRKSTNDFVCLVCDMIFKSTDDRTRHMACHEGVTNPDKSGHDKGHSASNKTSEFAIPIVDLSQKDTLAKLGDLGMRWAIPLSVLHAGNGNSIYGLPVVSLDSAMNPAFCNIGGIGASSLLPLGAMKNLSLYQNNK